MLAQNAFTLNDNLELADSLLDAEMAVISEWIVRDERAPDDLLTIFVAPMSDGRSLQAACSCPRGMRDQTCPHALLIIKTILNTNELSDQIFRKWLKSSRPNTPSDGGNQAA